MLISNRQEMASADDEQDRRATPRSGPASPIAFSVSSSPGGGRAVVQILTSSACSAVDEDERAADDEQEGGELASNGRCALRMADPSPSPFVLLAVARRTGRPPPSRSSPGTVPT